MFSLICMLKLLLKHSPAICKPGAILPKLVWQPQHIAITKVLSDYAFIDNNYAIYVNMIINYNLVDFIIDMLFGISTGFCVIFKHFKCQLQSKLCKPCGRLTSFLSFTTLKTVQ